MTKAKQSAKNQNERVVGHYQEGSPMARLFELLLEGKENDVAGLAEMLTKGTAGSLRSLKRDPNSSGKWILVRKNHAVRLAIRQKKKVPTVLAAQSRSAVSA